jgi:superfamily II DNA or RNA helicase
MTRPEDLKPGVIIKGLLPGSLVTIVSVRTFESGDLEVVFKDSDGRLANQLLFPDVISRLEIVQSGRPWSFDGDGALFRLVSEARRIRLAYLFDPLLAVHTSLVRPLPHQITAVYGEMIPRLPLRFLLADDPGSGKTIMAGLLIKELIARGDVQKCLVVCPGNLVDQWQNEMFSKFHLEFEIMTNDKFESARTGNWFNENNLVICRLDKLSRNEGVQEKLKATDWDLVICDEAHKMSATVFGGEVNYTKRYRLGQLLSNHTRHLLLLTATPHNGKEEEFQQFLGLLDSERFEGAARHGRQKTDTSDLMRRLVKEQLLTFEGKPLFPERIAYTANYTLSDKEANLYEKVTEYVRQEFNRAEKIENDGRRGTVGFALTVLQRRLASSPEAIYQSLHRRKERLGKRLQDEQAKSRGASYLIDQDSDLPKCSEDDYDDLEDSPDAEYETLQQNVTDRATAARTIAELEAEISTLRNLEVLAYDVRKSGLDKKWDELSKLLQESREMFDANGHRRKLIIFTEYKDTLNYLTGKIRSLLGKPEAVVTIDGTLSHDKRKLAENTFTQDKDTVILVATDAAGEGINLQRAHLMVNYDLPWNPNRLEQRFGRIHRIGQTEVCHLWNMVARETREGEVYHRLLEKLEQERLALGGQVFDVLGRLTFEDKPLRDLLLEAIRYGDRADVKARLDNVVDTTMTRKNIQQLLDEHALVRDVMDAGKVREIREDMERAEAKRLQPHFIASFFLASFRHLGGTIREREAHRYEITNVPAAIRSRGHASGFRGTILPKYERISFEKDQINLPGKPPAEFICPGHPLLDTVTDLIIEKYRDLLKQGTTLVDETDSSESVKAIVFLEHSVQDAHVNRDGSRKIVSQRLQFVELSHDGTPRSTGYAPYLDCRPLTSEEQNLIADLAEPDWMKTDFEPKIMNHAVSKLVPEHFNEVKNHRLEIVDKTIKAVRDRLVKEIAHWDRRATTLKDQELSGKINANQNSGEARKRADDLEERLKRRMRDLDEERNLSPLPPVIIGGALIIPGGLLAKIRGETPAPGMFARDTDRIEQLAMESVMETERRLGFVPKDVSVNNHYDIESAVPAEGRLRFIEVKGRITGATTVTVTKTEIFTALNKPDDFILALVEVDGEKTSVRYVRKPFRKEPDFAAASVNYNLRELMALSEEPR